MFRLEMGKRSALGIEAEKAINQGNLVEDSLVDKMLETRLAEPDCQRGFLLDGYPRTVAQAIFLSRLLADSGRGEPLVVHIDVPSPLPIQRISARRSCSQCGRIYNLLNSPPASESVCDVDGAQLKQRDDDRGEVISQRLVAYETWTRPVVEHYVDSAYFRIDGNQSLDAVFANICERLTSFQNQWQTR